MSRNGKSVIALLLVGALGALGFTLMRKDRGSSGASAPTAPSAPAAPTAPSAPAAPGRVHGTVTDAAGKPLPDAVVRLVPASSAADDRAELTVRTGADGTFDAPSTPPGRWRASASAPAHLPQSLEPFHVAAGDAHRLDFRLAPGGRTLSGTVTDATGGPVSGALVVASATHGLLSRTSADDAAALTDGAGHYQLTVAEGRQRVTAAHPEYVARTAHVDVGGSGARLDFQLVPGGAIEGVVLDAGSGAPVPGARVSVEREALADLPFGETMAIGRGRRTVTAGADGRFRVSGLEPGAISLHARAPGRVSESPTLVPLGVAEQVTGVEVVVQAALSVSGTVTVEGTGEPAAGVEVSALARDAGAGATTDAQGRFTIEGLLPGAYALVASGGDDILPGGGPVPVKLADTPLTGVQLTVKQGLAVRGRVEPPGVAEVRVLGDPEAMGPGGGAMVLNSNASTLAAADGTFRLGPVAPGPIRLEARAADGRRGEASVEVGPAGAEGVVIRLEERASIAGRVLDQDRKPVRGAVVGVKRVEKERRLTMIVNGFDVTTDRAPVADDGSYLLRGLAPGDYEITVLDDRGERLPWAKPADAARPAAPIAVTLAEHQKKQGVDLVVELPTGVIRGVALAPDGTPAADAWITATLVPDEPFGLPGRRAGGPPPPPSPPGPPPPGGAGAGAPGESRTEVRAMVMVTDDGDDGDGGFGGGGGAPPVLTDAQGRFEIRGLRKGRYRLLGEGEKGTARGMLADVAPGADVTLRLAALTELSGTVTTAEGAPVAQFTVDLTGPTRRSQRFARGSGSFLMARVDPGEYQVKVTAPEGTGHATVTVVAGQKAEIAVKLVGHAKVVGKVVDAGGAPVAGAPVVAAAVAPGGGVMVQIEDEPPTTGPDGSFALDVEPGKHMLLVLGPRGPQARQAIEVKQGQKLDVGVITAGAPPGPGPGPGAPPGP